MWNRGSFFAGLIIFAWLACTAHAQEGQWVNVKEQWCGNTCGEGHDDAACLCEYNRGQSPGSQYSWNTCYGAPCCAWATFSCSVGDPDCYCRLQDGSNPLETRRWCYASSPMVTCRASNISGTYECSYNCMHESECTISYPTTGPNWIYINGTSGQQCTGENETGFWSLAAWRSFFFGTNTCTLSQQSPWDDYPLENEICE